MNIPPEIKRIIMYYYQCSMRDKETKEQVMEEIRQQTFSVKFLINLYEGCNYEMKYVKVLQPLCGNWSLTFVEKNEKK